jgi:uncharacterized 2Fe-2S/4Fe-4S cluster protein (DUF4445 family)
VYIILSLRVGGLCSERKTLKEASIALGVDIGGICGEKAICGKCKVRIDQGFFEKYGIESSQEHLSPMGPTERKFSACNRSAVATVWPARANSR